MWKWARRFTGLVLGLAAFALVLGMCGVWIPIKTHKGEMDINSGAVRWTVSHFGIETKMEVRETWVTKAIPDHMRGAPEDWRLCFWSGDLVLGRFHSACTFRHAYYSQRYIASLFEHCAFTDDAKTVLAEAWLAQLRGEEFQPGLEFREHFCQTVFALPKATVIDAAWVQKFCADFSTQPPTAPVR